MVKMIGINKKGQLDLVKELEMMINPNYGYGTGINPFCNTYQWKLTLESGEVLEASTEDRSIYELIQILGASTFYFYNSRFEEGLTISEAELLLNLKEQGY